MNVLSSLKDLCLEQVQTTVHVASFLIVHKVAPDND